MEKKPDNTERKFAYQIADFLFHDMLLQMLDNVMEYQLADYRSNGMESVPSAYADYFIRRACAYRIIVSISKAVHWTSLSAANKLSEKRIEEAYRYYQSRLPSPEKRYTMRNEYIDEIILKYKGNLTEKEAEEYLRNPPADEVEFVNAILSTEDWGYMFEEERHRVFSIIDDLADTLVPNYEAEVEVVKENLTIVAVKLSPHKTSWFAKQPATSKPRKFISHCIEICILEEKRDSNGDIIGYCPTKDCTKKKFDEAMKLFGITKRAVFETKQICNRNGKPYLTYDAFYRKYLYRKKN